MAKFSVSDMAQQFTSPVTQPDISAYTGSIDYFAKEEDPRLLKIKVKDIKNAPNGVYPIALRFLANPFVVEDMNNTDPVFLRNIIATREYELPIISKINRFKNDPTETIKFPPEVARVKDEISELWWARWKEDQIKTGLKKDDTRRTRLKKEKLVDSPSERYYALVQVVEDIQHPERQGKVFVFQFGRAILSILYKSQGIELPSKYKKANDTQSQTAQNAPQSKFSAKAKIRPYPFDLVNAPIFVVEAKIKDGTENMPNYDSSAFIDEGYEGDRMPVSFVHPTRGQVTMTDTSDINQLTMYAEWLESIDAPDPSEFAYKGHTSEERQAIEEYLKYHTDKDYQFKVNAEAELDKANRMKEGSYGSRFGTQPTPTFNEGVAPQQPAYHQPAYAQPQVQPAPHPSFQQPVAQPAPQPAPQPTFQQPATQPQAQAISDDDLPF